MRKDDRARYLADENGNFTCLDGEQQIIFDKVKFRIIFKKNSDKTLRQKASKSIEFEVNCRVSHDISCSTEIPIEIIKLKVKLESKLQIYLIFFYQKTILNSICRQKNPTSDLQLTYL